MLERWATTVTRRRWWVLVSALVLVALAGIGSMTLTDRLQQGGYDVPGSESASAADTIERAVGQRTPDAVAVYTAPDGRAGVSPSDPQAIQAVRQAVADLPPAQVEKATG